MHDIQYQTPAPYTRPRLTGTPLDRLRAAVAELPTESPDAVAAFLRAEGVQGERGSASRNPLSGYLRRRGLRLRGGVRRRRVPGLGGAAPCDPCPSTQLTPQLSRRHV